MKKLIISILILMGLAAWAFPQATAEQSLRRYLVSPDFLRRNQQELQLTENQRDFIIQEINRTQSEYTSAKWKLQDEIAKLSEMIKGKDNGEEIILAQLDAVLDLEKEIKRKQLLLAVRIKNTLNEEQLAKLRALRLKEARRTRLSNPKANPAPRQRQLP